MCNYLIQRARHGFTLIELAVVVSIIGILAALLLNRVLFYHEQAEKVAMEQTLGTLRSALHLQIARYLLDGKSANIAQLPDENPMDWLAEKPGNYVGEYYSPKPGMIAEGSWYFDVPTKCLVYLAHSHEHLHVASGEENKLQFRAKVLTSLSQTLPSANATQPSEKFAEGVILEPVISYQWF